ncbi:MAG TPA: class I SAM-dependent methyltransferase [Alphaproteobacteria bacterium]|nr:class I SAM-dependent methyltransferase [Alphaproteobacteria bacterium]
MMAMASRDAAADPRPAPELPVSYSRWRGSRLGRITDALEQRLVLDLADPVDRADVLDLGCGDGALACALARRGATVTGLDADPRMLVAAQARAEAEAVALDLVHARAEALPFPDGAFDRVVAITVLCFIQEADRAVAEMARVLRPGGRLVIGELGRWSVWAAIRRVRGWLGAPTWRAARFRGAGELSSLLQRHGLEVGEPRGAIFYPPCGLAASLMASSDPWLGRHMPVGAAFIVVPADKPASGAAAGRTRPSHP